MGNWTLRKAQHRDADALSACIDAAYAQYVARIADLPPVSAGCAGEIAKNQVWVAETGTDIVGGLVMEAGEDFMLLTNVAVHPNHRGTGLGRALVALAETAAVEQGYREMRLTTHVDMPDNVRFYGRLGWQQNHRHGNKIMMKKMIGDARGTPSPIG